MRIFQNGSKGIYMLNKFLPVFISLFFAVGLSAQAPTMKPSALTGDVLSITESLIVLQTKEGALNVGVSAATEFKKVPPDNPKLSAATVAAASDISVGDKLLVTGILSEDKSSLPARAVYLMTKSDIAQRNQADTQRWATRGISGKVASANKETGQLTIEVRGLAGTQNVTVTPRTGAKFLRYKQDSVQYSEAVSGTISDVQAGDMVRALGDRSSDGLSFSAEEIVTGAFRTVAGTVKSINADGTEIVITELQTKKDVTVSIGRSSTLKKFPEELATRMAGNGGGGGRPGAGQGQGGGRQANAGAPNGAPAGGAGGGLGRPGMGGGPRGGIDDMYERFPVIKAAELKAGDMIAVSSSKNGVSDRITAIKLLAGVEPFVRAAQIQQSASGRGGRGGQGAGFSIPGLDGFDNP